MYEMWSLNIDAVKMWEYMPVAMRRFALVHLDMCWCHAEWGDAVYTDEMLS